jgi:hypothetical protein
MQQQLTANDLTLLDAVFKTCIDSIKNYNNGTKSNWPLTVLTVENVEKLHLTLKDIMAVEKFGDQDLIHLSLFRKQVDQIQTALQNTAHQCMILGETGKGLGLPYPKAFESSLELTEISATISHQLNASK